jgi:CRISPR-associated endonuclease/helicase Cas3
MSLSAANFPAIFAAIHRMSPFAWQIRLLQHVIEHGWPDTIAAPTGSGKTAVLDVALCHLALEAGRTTGRRAPRRIVLAVDRRVVVDQAFERAKRIHDALSAANGGVLASFADALRRISSNQEPPLHVEELRGGMPREDDWARDPGQPTILCTTVDQLGSRLLFRGYGVTPGMAPIHAGLLGEDALLLLDEAHLSAAFRETLEAVGRSRTKRTTDLGLPWAACMLTATPSRNSRSIFDLKPEERLEPGLNERLARPKRVRLHRSDATVGSPEHVAAFVRSAKELVAGCERAACTVAIVVNRVALARRIFAALPVGQRLLLTGRVRPIERDELIEQYRTRLFSQRPPDTVDAGGDGPLFVVATQCIEAGADFDFDAMVTQIAPLDALQQRFGRLNRLGLWAESAAVILAAKGEIAGKAWDALYQDRLKATWDWLENHAALEGKAKVLDMSPEAARARIAADADGAAACVAQTRSAPVLRAADVAFFSTTNPAPHPDPYLPLFLHGEVNSDADVSIVWRADCLDPPNEVAVAESNRMTREVVACVLPRPAEALRVPIWAAKAWLSADDTTQSRSAELADAEGEEAPSEYSTARGKRVFRWRGPDDMASEWIYAKDLKPGDVLVVPAGYGGCDRYGWAPASPARVNDLADAAGKPFVERYLALRLHPALWPHSETKEPSQVTGDPQEDRGRVMDATQPWNKVWPGLREAAEADARSLLSELAKFATGAIKMACDRLTSSPRLELAFPYGSDTKDEPIGLIVIAPRGVRTGAGSGTATTEDDLGSLFSSAPVELKTHINSVVEQAERMASAVGLPSPLRAAVRYAALHHDDGKMDPRFQAWLMGLDARSDRLLAKSGRWRGAAQEAAAKRAAGLPTDWRHEVLSVRAVLPLLEQCLDAFDTDLALYLIGTHHGQGRPFFSHVDPWDKHERVLRDTTLPPGPGAERLDFDYHGYDWSSLFAALRGRYGAWGLALLEAVLRLADHRASEKPI